MNRSIILSACILVFAVIMVGCDGSKNPFSKTDYDLKFDLVCY